MDHPVVLAVCALIVSTAIVLLVHVPQINAWEKANGYPYGQMCNSMFTLYTDTCKH